MPGSRGRASRPRSSPSGSAVPRATDSTAWCSRPASTGARRWCFGRCVATCCRPACPSASATWNPRWRATRRSPRASPGSSRRASTRRCRMPPAPRSSARSGARSTRRSSASRAPTMTASCARSVPWSRRPGVPTTSSAMQRACRNRTCRSSSIRSCCRNCRSHARCSRSGSTRRGSRACTCAWARWREAACAGRTGARTSAPRSSA